MPFRLKLKKTRQYNVLSKSLFVISIELLDGVIVECTLGYDSTGQDCLENVCQRLVINQPEFFGLRYINRSHQPRWVDLERPLKRQLDKYASSHQLYLRVMYYVISGTKLITDEVTRYHYFLQLKNDVVEGRIVCDCQQAVLLASYSRQAEYGNHDTERHTVDYLKNLLSFPKQMFDGGQIIDASQIEGGRLERLTAAVIHQHQALHNLPQAQAEEGYICACQVLNGYGQETFVARDQTKQMEIMIAISLTGIMVATENSDTPKAYRWTDITNVINHKRTFSIECQNPSDSATFVFPTPEDGKYIWRMCVLQHTFYMKHQQSITTVNGSFHGSTMLDVPQPNFQNNGLADSRDDLDNVLPDRRESFPGLIESNVQSVASLEQSVIGSTNFEPLRQMTNVQRAHSTSCLDLTSSNSHLAQQQRDVDKLRALLPTYRAAPDYETAVQQKYQRAQTTHFNHNHQSHSHAHVNQVNTTKPIIYGSHPEIHRQVHYPDVTRHTAVSRPSEELGYGLNIVRQENYQGFGRDGNVINPKVNQPIQYLNVYKPPPPYPSNGLVSNSTPDLAVASQALGAKTYHRGFINAHVSGSSPDLVSSRSILNRQYMGYLHGGNVHNIIGYTGVRGVSPSAHGTYENLASVMDVPSGHVLIDPSPHLMNHIQKVYDERGNIMYCMPSSQVSYQTRLMLPQAQKIPSMKSTQEPIYENVPLPWQNEQQRLNTMRERAQSLTMAPDMTRTPERKSSQPVGCIHNEHKALIHSQPNISITAAYNPNVQVPNINYDSLYANVQVLKANAATNELKQKPIIPKSNLKQDINALSNSVDALSVSRDRDDKRDNHTGRVSLGSAHISVNESSKQLDKSVPSSIKDSVQSLTTEHFYNNNSILNTPAPSDILLNASQTSLASNRNNIDTTAANSSYFDSVHTSTTELESSSSTNASVSSKEKKRRRWGMFIGKSSKTTEIKSATLGRDTKNRNVKMVEPGPAARHRWSTGLPKFQPLPPSITKETLCQILERKMSDTQLAFAFQQIPKGREMNAEMTTAMLLENVHINGTAHNYLPYEDNRVKLLPMKNNKHGYVNASHITMTVGNSQRFYVIASIPSLCSTSAVNLPANIEDYCALLWTLVWEIGAKVIALVTADVKPLYIPTTKETAEYGQFSVYTESSQQTEYGTTSHICLSRGKMTRGTTPSSSQLRSVWHVHYKQWPLNAQVPHLTEHFLGFLSEVSALRRHCVSEIRPPHNANPPLLLVSPAMPMHPTSSAPQFSGTPASTALTADLLLHSLDHNQELDIPRTISLLHQQRANLIQNIHQYRFLHEILINYLKKSRLI